MDNDDDKYRTLHKQKNSLFYILSYSNQSIKINDDQQLSRSILMYIQF